MSRISVALLSFAIALILGSQLHAQPKITVVAGPSTPPNLPTYGKPYGNARDSSTQEITILNEGSQTLRGAFHNNNRILYRVEGDAFSIPPGFYKTFTQKFKPYKSEYSYDTLTIISNATWPDDTLRWPFVIWEHLYDTIHADFNPTSLDFGNVPVGSWKSMSFEIPLTGDTTNTYTALVKQPYLPFILTTGGGYFSVHPPAVRTVTVEFAPQRPGEYWDTLRCQTNNYPYKGKESATPTVPLHGIALVSGVQELAIGNASFASVYPNPAGPSTIVQLAMEKPEEVTVTLADAAGKRVYYTPPTPYPAGLSSLPLDLSDLPSGSYYCLISSAKGQKLVKIIHTRG